MGLIKASQQFADILWQVAARARELETRLPTDIDLPSLERQLAAIVASLTR